jgi:hypothetical protein
VLHPQDVVGGRLGELFGWLGAHFAASVLGLTMSVLLRCVLVLVTAGRV